LSASIRNVSELDDGMPILSPQSSEESRTPRTAPSSPRLQTTDNPSVMQQVESQPVPLKKDPKPSSTNGQTSPRITAMPELPPSPTNSQAQKHAREPSKSFFSNLMASKSSHRLHASETSLPEAGEKSSARSRTSSKDRSVRSVRRQGSTPELPRYNMTPSQQSNHEPIATTPSQDPGQMLPPSSKKGKSKLGGMLTRTKTLRGEESSKARGAPSPLKVDTNGPVSDNVEPPPKTAPLKSDHRARAFGEANGNAPRNRSADRIVQNEPNRGKKDHRQTQHMPASHSFQGGSNLLSNIQQTSKGVGDRLNKAGKGWFGKVIRSGSSIERESMAPEEHIVSIINLPLVKQTRKTRIARRLELSKDKTEFWMPALPWRCIE
jgi:hypothetical protein